jgi:F420-dependent oxidoreductase-like protein
MRLGVMIGAERGDMARKVKKLLEDIEWAEGAGFDTAWMPQVPNDFDCLTMVALMGARTSRIELGTAVVPLQAQHPIALARQALSVHAGVGGRLALGVGPSHHWIVRDMLGIPYEKPAAYTRDYLEVLNTALAGPGEVDVENESFTVHNPTVLGAESPMPVLVAALGPVMLQIAGELAGGTVLWMADERAIGDHIAPRITKAAECRLPCDRSEGPVHKAVRGVGFVVVVDGVMGQCGGGNNVGLGRSRETQHGCGQTAGTQCGTSELPHFDAFLSTPPTS